MVKYERMNQQGDITTIREIPQNDLSSECWIVQMEGLDACFKCEFVDTTECGGPNIRKYGWNEKGHKVPLGDVPHG